MDKDEMFRSVTIAHNTRVSIQLAATMDLTESMFCALSTLALVMTADDEIRNIIMELVKKTRHDHTRHLNNLVRVEEMMDALRSKIQQEKSKDAH